MGLYVEATGRAFDSKIGTFAMVGAVLVGLYLAVTSFGLGSGSISYKKPSDIAAMEYRKTGKDVQQDWEYPALFGLAHRYAGDGQLAAEIRREFRKFEGQIAHPGEMRDNAEFMEQKVWATYARYLIENEKGMTQGTIRDKAKAVQLATKNIRQREDFYAEWRTPAEMVDRGGDCEDIALLKYWLLMRLGVPERNIRMVHVDGTDRKSRRDNTTHVMVAVIVSPKEWTMLDNGAYFPKSNTYYVEWEEDELKVFSSSNRMGNWTHNKFAEPVYGLVTPDIERQCKKRRLRREYGLDSEDACHGYILSQSPGNMSPRFTELWDGIGATDEHFPHRRIGIADPFIWTSHESFSRFQAIYAEAREIRDEELRIQAEQAAIEAAAEYRKGYYREVKQRLMDDWRFIDMYQPIYQQPYYETKYKACLRRYHADYCWHEWGMPKSVRAKNLQARFEVWSAKWHAAEKEFDECYQDDGDIDECANKYAHKVALAYVQADDEVTSYLQPLLDELKAWRREQRGEPAEPEPEPEPEDKPETLSMDFAGAADRINAALLMREVQ